MSLHLQVTQAIVITSLYFAEQPSLDVSSYPPKFIVVFAFTETLIMLPTIPTANVTHTYIYVIIQPSSKYLFINVKWGQSELIGPRFK